jgi:DNA polymerase III sliding clamp (beta) subunit (PCNA family)
MVTIKRESFNEFFRKTGGIDSNPLMPILNYILLQAGGGKCSLTKTNLQTFCNYTFEAEGECAILMEETTLKALCSTSESDIIDITVLDEHTIQISDGSQTLTFDTFPITEYPKFPEKKGKAYTIPTEVIRALACSVAYIDPKHPRLQYVHIVNNGVFGSDSMTMYYKSFDLELPPLILAKQSVNSISQFEELTYSTNGAFDFFGSNDTTYGFTRTADYRSPDIKSLIGMTKTEGIKIRKALIEKFCSVTGAISELDKTPIGKVMDGGNGIVTFKYENHDIKKKNELPCIVEGKTKNILEFCFIPKNLLNAMRAIPYEYIRFSRAEENANFILFWADEDKDYLGFMAGVNNMSPVK